jgi:hypothetical protein
MVGIERGKFGDFIGNAEEGGEKIARKMRG